MAGPIVNAIRRHLDKKFNLLFLTLDEEQRTELDWVLTQLSSTLAQNGAYAIVVDPRGDIHVEDRNNG